MKKPIFLLAIASLFMALTFSGCQRLKDLLDPEIEQHNTDSNDLKTEFDQIDDDINNSINNLDGFGKTDETFSSPMCGATMDTSELAQNTVYFNFDGSTPCFSPSRTRSGQIKVELINGQYWGDAGAVIKQTFTNVKITRLSDDRSLEFNGTRTLENVNGFNWWEFLLGNESIMYRARMVGMDVTFDNNQSATWNHARTTMWSYIPNGDNPDIPHAYFKFEANGDTAVNGHSSTDSWGVNRYGSDFVNYYNSSIESDTYFGLWRPTQGEVVHAVDNAEYSLTLGVDEDGNASTELCGYGFKVSWDVGGDQNEQIFSY